MKNILMMILTTILISNTAFAQNSVTLNEGDIAPFKGHLVKKERLEKLVKAEKSNIVLKDLRVTQEVLIEYHREDAMVQREKLSKAKFDSNLKSVGYFVLGAVITALTFRLNQKVGEI